MQIGLRYYFFFQQSIPIINGYHCPSRVHILYIGLWCSRGLSPKFLIIIIIIAQTVLCRKGVVNATRSPNDSSRAEKHGSKISKKGFRFVKKGRSSNTHTKKKLAQQQHIWWIGQLTTLPNNYNGIFNGWPMFCWDLY